MQCIWSCCQDEIGHRNDRIQMSDGSIPIISHHVLLWACIPSPYSHTPLSMIDESLQAVKLNQDKKIQVWFDLCLHLLRRGRENITELTVDHFKVTTDAAGNRYVYQSIDEQTKNHQDDASKRQGRMYEVQENELCPVSTFEEYCKRLNPASKKLFQLPRPMINAGDVCWYQARPVGHNTLGRMMVAISEAAKLSRRYTNHCLRTTSVTLLDAANFAGRHIMTVSGHKSETSIKNYAHHTNEATKREMSKTFNRSLGLTAKSISASNSINISETCVVPSTCSASAIVPMSAASTLQPADLPTSQPQVATPQLLHKPEQGEIDISDDILATLLLPDVHTNTAVSSHPNSNFQWNMPLAPVIKDCNVTINYYIGKQ